MIVNYPANSYIWEEYNFSANTAISRKFWIQQISCITCCPYNVFLDHHHTHTHTQNTK